MLLGSNLPIFGNDLQPAVSIRLCDMSKPITVLTGLDYWLDNLMCNVPQVAMCYHLNGIVQVSYYCGNDPGVFTNGKHSMCLCTHAFNYESRKCLDFFSTEKYVLNSDSINFLFLKCSYFK